MIKKLQSRLKISQLRSSVYIASINKMTTTTGTNAFTIPTLISLSSKIFQSTTIILEYFSVFEKLYHVERFRSIR